MRRASPEQQTGELFAVFTQRNADGTQRFSNAEIRHYLPLVVLSSDLDFGGMPDVTRLMNEFMAKLQLPAQTDGTTFTRAVQRFYRLNPPNPELERQVLEFCRSLAVGELDPERVRMYAKAAGIRVTDHSPIKGMARPSGGLSLRARR